VIATAGNGSAVVSWQAPASDGGSPITQYTVSYGQNQSVVVAAPATTVTATGLTNGTSYDFIVMATNAIGTGPASSPSNVVTPSAPTAPGPPLNVSATFGNGTAAVSWQPPASDGGSPITSYQVITQLAIPGTGVIPNAVTVGCCTVMVNGLTNGATYSFMVQAINAVGSSPFSAPSNSGIPVLQPANPNNTAATAIPLGTITCPNGGGTTLVSKTGDNTTGTHAWYTFTFSQTVLPQCTLTVGLSGTNDLFSVAGAPSAAQTPTLVTSYSTTSGGVYLIDVSGGTAGNNFTLTSSTH
jgi:hypothetical protein